MRKIPGLLALLLLLLPGPKAWAEGGPDVGAIQERLAVARGTLLSMLNPADTVALDGRIAVLKMKSDEIDRLTENQAEFRAFRDSWVPFRTTRDTEIIPLLKAKKYDEAKALATGIQQERMQKMTTALNDLKK